jgi:acyl carrier protein
MVSGRSREAAMGNERAAIERRVRDFLKSIAPSLADVIESFPADGRLWETVDSLSLLDLLECLEQRFNILIEPVDVIPDNFRTLERIVAYVARTLEAKASGG